MKTYGLLTLLFLWMLSLTAIAQRSVLEGTLTDAITEEPLAGASVAIDTLHAGTLTDSLGHYRLADLQQGLYIVTVRLEGYQDAFFYETRIEAGVTQRSFKLQPLQKNLQGVLISSSPYQKTPLNIISVKTIGQEQIRSNAGGLNDISRVVQTLPGVAGAVGFRNDLIVRGGAPTENVYYLDGVEVPNINHFATQGGGGGAIGALNSNLISSVKFQSSNFSPQYDNALSSVLDFEMLSGNTERLQTTLAVSGYDAGLTLSTPLGSKITALVSGRKTYLKPLFKLLGQNILPDYYDFQSKVQWQLSPRTTLTFISLTALDKLTPNPPTSFNTQKQIDMLDNAKNYPYLTQNAFTEGLVLKQLTGKGYFTLAVSRTDFDKKYQILSNITNGAIQDDYNSNEQYNKLRFNAVTLLGAWRMGYGLVGQLDNYQNSSTTYKIADSPTRLGNTLHYAQYGLYGSASRSLLQEKLLLSMSLRADGNNFTSRGNDLSRTLSPRIALSYQLAQKWYLNASYGIFYKLPPMTLLGYGNGSYLNQGLAYIRSTHYVSGLEYRLTPKSIFTLEGFYKQYSNYPAYVNNGGYSLANEGTQGGAYGNNQATSSSNGRTYGVEFFFQQRFDKHLYGVASATYYRSEFTTGSNPSHYLPSVWDDKYLLSLSGGYQFGKQNRWEVASKLRVLGAAAYTPFNLAASAALYQQNGGSVLDYNQINSSRTAPFSQVDLRIDRKWYFSSWSLNVYVDVQNLLNSANSGAPSFGLQRDPNNPQQYLHGAQGNVIPRVFYAHQAMIPTAGVRVTF